MKHIQYSVALLLLMLSAQTSSGQSSHSVSRNNVALGCNHRNADSTLVSRLNVGLANNVDSLWVAAECSNIIDHPLNGSHLIQESVVAAALVR